MQDLELWIKNCEGLDLHTYVDTNGHVTVGWGRNLENGIRLDEAELMFQNDLKQTIGELEPLAWFSTQPQGVKNALINMNFNLGITKLLEFKDMISALEKKDYTTAAQAALNSVWAKEVHERATDIAVMIRAGQ
jgi:lysozyme